MPVAASWLVARFLALTPLRLCLVSLCHSLRSSPPFTRSCLVSAPPLPMGIPLLLHAIPSPTARNYAGQLTCDALGMALPPWQVLNDAEHHKFFLRIELCDGGQCMPGNAAQHRLGGSILPCWPCACLLLSSTRSMLVVSHGAAVRAPMLQPRCSPCQQRCVPQRPRTRCFKCAHEARRAVGARQCKCCELAALKGEVWSVSHDDPTRPRGQQPDAPCWSRRSSLGCHGATGWTRMMC